MYPEAVLARKLLLAVSNEEVPDATRSCTSNGHSEPARAPPFAAVLAAGLAAREPPQRRRRAPESPAAARRAVCREPPGAAGDGARWRRSRSQNCGKSLVELRRASRGDDGGGDGGGGAAMAEHLASIFGTEKDRVNCPFYFKIGSCRHGDRCSRLHNRPTISPTLLLSNMYQRPDAPQPGQELTQMDPREVQQHFDDFYEDLFEELSKHGELESLNVCDNMADHMVGNVYALFKDESSAAAALHGLMGRFYAGRPIIADFSPVTDFREATCRQYEEQTCNRGGYCNFMHLRRISRDLRRKLFGRTTSSRRQSRSRSRSLSPLYRDYSRERDYRDDHYAGVLIMEADVVVVEGVGTTMTEVVTVGMTEIAEIISGAENVTMAGAMVLTDVSEVQSGREVKRDEPRLSSGIGSGRMLTRMACITEHKLLSHPYQPTSLCCVQSDGCCCLAVQQLRRAGHVACVKPSSIVSSASDNAGF
eukprot:SM000005S17261  [mRNA]  locus=s5:1056707:1058813:- [translate_table: standard]